MSEINNKELAEKMFKQGKKLIEISKELNVPEGTIRSWKNRYKWECNATKKNNATLQKKMKVNKVSKKTVAKEVESVLANTDLNDRQRLFCLYQVKYFNATKAYKKAYGCDEYTARVNGSKLLTKASIKNEIYKLKQNKFNQAMLQAEDIMQKYMDIAFADITDYLEFKQEEVPMMGAFGPIVVTDEETGAKVGLTKIINVVKFKDSNFVDGSILAEVKQGRDGASIKLNDRMKALEWLTEHSDMLSTETKIKLSLEIEKAQGNSGNELAEAAKKIEKRMGKDE